MYMDRALLLSALFLVANVSACTDDSSTSTCQAEDDKPPAWSSAVVAATFSVNAFGGQSYTANATNTENLTGRTDLFPAFRIARLAERSIRVYSHTAPTAETTLAQVDWTAPAPADGSTTVSAYGCPAGSGGFAGSGRCWGQGGNLFDVVVARVVGQTTTAPNGDVRVVAAGSNVQIDLTLPALPAGAETSCFALPQIY